MDRRNYKGRKQPVSTEHSSGKGRCQPDPAQPVATCVMTARLTTDPAALKRRRLTSFPRSTAVGRRIASSDFRKNAISV